MAITLGSIDPTVTAEQREQFFADLRQIADEEGTRLRGDTGWVPLTQEHTAEQKTVKDLQQQLIDSGFFPGGKVDGIFGYRTRAALRLFQEYIRAIEKRPCTPDGIAGPQTYGEMTRWKSQRLETDWASTLASWKAGTLSQMDCEFNDWIMFLNALRARCLRHPDPVISLVNAFGGQSDTLSCEQWRFDDADVHLVGIRRKPDVDTHKFDDLFVLLVKGLVFKFQGSTDPGFTKNVKGAPFLVRGQHRFRFGLHRSSYHALRPLSYAEHGVLTVRSKGDYRLTDDDLANGLENNGTINIHWGGKGVGRPVNRWSEGCQVIAGSAYQNHHGQLISCADYVATNNKEAQDRRSHRTRGAYNVLSDLIVALSSDMNEPGLVRYMLLDEDDLTFDAGIASLVMSSCSRAREFMKTL